MSVVGQFENDPLPERTNRVHFRYQSLVSSVMVYSG
jgi:hypothetical protein